jgi:hypothetical protein
LADIFGNSLRILPPSLGATRNLLYVDASDNLVTQLPYHITRGHISQLHMQDNPVNSTAHAVSRVLELSSDHLTSFGMSFHSKATVLGSDVTGHSFCNHTGPNNQEECANPITGVNYKCTWSNCLPKLKVSHDCRVGEACLFQLKLSDSEGFYNRIGGLRGINVRGHGGKSIALTDNRDGSYTGSIPGADPDFVRQKGRYKFQLFMGTEEFWVPVSIFDEFMCKQSFSDWTESSYPHCSLEIEFGPRDCSSGRNTVPDAKTGLQCVCRDNTYVKDEDVMTNGSALDGDTAKSGVSCHKSCQTTAQVNYAGDSCWCGNNNYNTSVFGTLLCRPYAWQVSLHMTSAKDWMYRIRHLKLGSDRHPKKFRSTSQR